jgi:WD40 repeat protein
MAASKQPSGDFLDRLWSEVINPDPEGLWLEDFIRQPDSSQHPVAGAKAAMEEVLAAGLSTVDLGHHSRYIRYSTCASVLYRFGDPGLEEGRLAGLHEALAEGPRRTREREFFAEAWSDAEPEAAGVESKADSDRWDEFISETRRDPFGDVLAAVERMRAQGMAYKTLMTLQSWHIYEATYQTLRLAAEHFHTADELSGLDGELLAAEPTGSEAAPGSWPLPGSAASARQPAAEAARNTPEDPLFVLPGTERFSFSPDSQFIAACGKTAPIHILGSRDGAEIATCKFLKEEVYGLQFSPASDSLAAVHPRYISFFEAGTGSLLRQIKQDNFESLQWWHSDGGDVLFLIRWLSDNRSNPGYKFEIYESDSLRQIAEVAFPGIEGHLSNFKLSPDGSRAGLVWRPPEGGRLFMTVWSWPECVLLGRWDMIYEYWAWSPDGRSIATMELRGCVLKDAVSGNIVWENGEPEKDMPHLAITPDGEWLVNGRFKGHISIWSIPERKKVRDFQLTPNYCFDLQLSPDGRVLGVTSQRRCLFWDFQRLTAT